MKILVPVNGCEPALDAVLHGDKAAILGARAYRHPTQDSGCSDTAHWPLPRPSSHGGRPVAANRVQPVRRAP